MKFDVSKIEGFETMSDSEKINALLNSEIEVPQPDNAEAARLKNALNKANGEAAEYKRQLREKQTEAERIAAEAAEREKAREEELAMYKSRERIANYRSKLMEIGYDSVTADAMANALPDGVKPEFFDSQKSYLENKVSEIKNEALNANPKLSTGTPPKGMTKDDEIVAQAMKFAGL